jgi:FHA domain
MLSLELLDSGLILAQQQGDGVRVIGEAPGLAVLEDKETLTGAAAAARVRLRPLLAQSNYWRAISTDALARPSRLIGTSADLAFAQVSQILEPHKNDAEGVLLAVPAGYSREQLGLLLGVVGETGVRVAGLVDAGLAAGGLEPASARVLHLELELHQALLTVLEYVGGERPGLKRARYEIAPRRGVLALQQTWMKLIAEEFVRKTRFDPLHEAASEQHLFNELPVWLAQLASQSPLTLTMQFGERLLEIELTREQFIAAAEAHYADLVTLVQDARVAGVAIELRLSHRIAALPGLRERFEALRDCSVEVLPQGAAALGALRYEAAIRRPAESLALVYHLPTPRISSAESSASHIEATPPPLRPTHVLFQGRAWQISERPLAIGWSLNGAARALTLPSAAPGVSRSHCTLVRRNGSVVVEDHSTYGSFVNEERVVGRTVLTVGDRLRLGAPGVTLDLIQLVNDHGAPQD